MRPFDIHKLKETCFWKRKWEITFFFLNCIPSSFKGTIIYLTYSEEKCLLSVRGDDNISLLRVKIQQQNILI